MSRSRLFAVALGSAAALVLPACGEDGTGPDPIDNIVITTAAGGTAPAVQKGRTVSLVAKAFRGGAEVTGVRFTFRSETPDVATIDTTGIATGVSFGTAQIVAEARNVPSEAVGRVALEVVGPQIASVTVSPQDTFIDIGDTVRFLATARDSSNAVQSSAEFTFALVSGAGNVTFNAVSGTAIGVAPGSIQVEGSAINSQGNPVADTAAARVTPVTAITPDTGKFGLIVSIEGVGLPTGARVTFQGSGTSRVQAFIRSSSSTKYEVWVPVFAVTGNLRFVTATDSFTTSRRFQVTGTDDLYDDANDTTFVALPFPFTNPSLLAVGGEVDIDAHKFGTPSAGPVSFFVANRGPTDLSTTAIAFFIRANPLGVTSLMIPADFVSGRALDSAVYSAATLPADTYFIFVWGFPLAGTTRHPYGMTLTAAANFAMTPDNLEPNDIPADGPTITLPFDRSDLVFENGWASDHYVFTLTDTMIVTANLTGSVDVDLYLLAGDSIDWIAAALFGRPDPTLKFSATDATSEAVTDTLPPGTYTLSVYDFSGRATTYRLQASAVAAAGVSLAAPSPPAPSMERKRKLEQVMPAGAVHRLREELSKLRNRR